MARIALALGSGGARGYAHIGVIGALQRRGHHIVRVAGSSMGAVVGGAFAAGELEAFTTWARGLSRSGVFRQLDPSRTSAGVLRAERVLSRMAGFVGGRRIEALPIPFTAVAVDLLAGREVWLDHGPLDRAIRASIGIPGLFTPTELNGRLLVDGGVLDPVPIAAVAGPGADAVVAVSLHGGQEPVAVTSPAKETADRRPPAEWWTRFRTDLEELVDSGTLGAAARTRRSAEPDPESHDASAEHDVAGEDDALPKVSLPEVLRLSLAAAESELERHILATHPPDVLISIPGNACRTVDFHRAAEMIDLGFHTAEEALESARLPAR